MQRVRWPTGRWSFRDHELAGSRASGVDTQIAEAIRLHQRAGRQGVRDGSLSCSRRSGSRPRSVAATPTSSPAGSASGYDRPGIGLSPGARHRRRAPPALDVVIRPRCCSCSSACATELGLALILRSLTISGCWRRRATGSRSCTPGVCGDGPVSAVFGGPAASVHQAPSGLAPDHRGARASPTQFRAPSRIPAKCGGLPLRPRCPYAAERCFSDPGLRECAPVRRRHVTDAPWSDCPARRTPPQRGAEMNDA